MELNKLNVFTPNLSPGEFFDRFTIILRKSQFSPNFTMQLAQFKEVLSKAGLDAEFFESLCLLMMQNTDIWNLESDIRKGKEGTLGLKEVGERAIRIRETNFLRIQCVNKINQLCGSEVKEEKIDHVSK